MDQPLKQEHILGILYDLAMATSGESRSMPLIARFMQRLMFHTGTPVGLFIDHIGKDSDNLRSVRLVHAIGDQELSGRRGYILSLPSILFAEATPLIRNPALNKQDELGAWHTALRLRVTDDSAFLLLTPDSIQDNVPWIIAFRPVLDNFSRVLSLCKENEAQTASLAVANHELEAFSYSVSHDLRAPLRTVNGFSQALLEDYGHKLDETGQKYLGRIRAGVQNMDMLIDDMLKLARVTRTPLKPTVVNLSAMTLEIISRLRQSEPGRDVHIEVTEDLRAQGDPGLLRIVLENLLGNAWKYTGKTASAEISFDSIQRDGETCFRVRDNGVGFDMKFADKLFGAFQRMHHRDEFEGTGIGLATVQRIVHRHMGRTWAEAALNKGAAFHFTLGRSEDTRVACMPAKPGDFHRSNDKPEDDS